MAGHRKEQVCICKECWLYPENNVKPPQVTRLENGHDCICTLTKPQCGSWGRSTLGVDMPEGHLETGKLVRAVPCPSR